MYIYIYEVYIYIYIKKKDNNACLSLYIYRRDFDIFHYFRTHANIYIKIFSYIQNFAQNIIEMFKLTIYNTNHTQNTKIHFFFFSVKYIFFRKIDIHSNQRFALILWPAFGGPNRLV